jgi:ABC-type oligopeptide transport system substrate-binding subunit
MFKLKGRSHAWITKAVIAPVAAFAAVVAAGAAISAPPPSNVLQVDLTVDIDYVDPALSYYVPAWQIEYATCSRLLTYPDAPAPAGSVLQPEIASGLPAVSPDGRTYTFTVRDDFFFSPPSNERVTAAHFKYAVDRALNRSMNSPAQPFMVDIVGADEVISGQATSVSGVIASGNTLTIQLKQPAADFLARVAMPFFCPLPTSVPIAPDGIGAPVPSAGPYYVERWTRGQEVLLKENPNYTGDRPHHFDEIHYTIGLPLETIKLRIETGDADLGDIPPASHGDLGLRYGPGSPPALAGRQRYFFYPAPTVLYLAMNHDRPLFGSGGPRGNVNLKKAVNYAIDRTAMMEQRGAYAGEPTDQHLPRGIRGFRNVEIYPSRPDVSRARELAGWSPGDPMRNGVFYCSNRAPAPQICQIVQANLRQIGLEMDIKLFPRATQFELAGRRGEPFDMTLEGWHMNYYDPIDFLFLFDGSRLKPLNNLNFSYFNDPEYNQRITAANLLSGDDRADAFGAVDIDIARNAAPWAAYGIPNDRLFFSDRVGCQTYVPKYGISLGALCLRPAISIGDAIVAEGDSGSITATFTLSLAEAVPAAYPVTVSYATADGTAGPSDYAPASGTVTFAAGEQTKTIEVNVSGDTLPERTETFHVQLSSPTKGTVVDGRGVGRIVNDDGGDTTPPTNPSSLVSPSHFAGEWSSDPLVEMEWLGADDDSAVEGYSVAWSSDAATVPDEQIDLAETTFVDQLDDGSWWFHVRAIDTSGNAAVGAAHRGPYRIDTTPPHDPVPSSTSHAVGMPSPDNTVDITWASGTDGDGSGVAGYSYSWTRNAGTLPDDIVDSNGASATSPALADGAWWFHLRSVDKVGNWTATVHLGPFVIAPPVPPQAPPPPPAPPPPAAPPPPTRPPTQARCVVPNVRGKTVAQARRMLANRRCVLGRVTRAYSAKTKLGRIISQSRRPTARLPRGTRVHVVVSRGRRR